MHPYCGMAHNQCTCRFFNPINREILLVFLHFFFLFRFVFFVFVFSLIVSFRFSLHRMCMSYLSYLVSININSMMTWQCIAHWLTAHQVRGNVVSLWRSFVTKYLVSLLGLKNRNGNWLFSMSTGRKNGLNVKNTHKTHNTH